MFSWEPHEIFCIKAYTTLFVLDNKTCIIRGVCETLTNIYSVFFLEDNERLLIVKYFAKYSIIDN